MTRDVFNAALGWRSLGIAAILLATTPGHSPAARAGGGRAVVPAPEGPVVEASASASFRSGRWLGARRDGAAAIEVDLDELLRDIGAGGLRLDRETLTQLGQGILGDGVAFEAMSVGDVLDRVGRVRVTSQGLSVVFGRRTLVRVLQQLLGTEERVDTLQVSDVLDRLTGAEVTADGVRDRLDQQTLLAAVGGLLGNVERPTHAADPAFERRQTLQRRYDRVVSLVREIRRELAGAAPDATRLYDEAYNRLLKANEADAVPLLDGHLRMEEELAGALLPSMSRAERVAARWPARRSAFGDEVAELLFGRQEAMERYGIDRLAIEADGALSAEQKKSRLEKRRQALKVELAAQGSYVAFSDPSGAAVRLAPAGEPTAGAQPAPRGGRRQ